MAKDKKTPSIASQGAVLRRVLQYIGRTRSLVVLSLALCLISVALTLYVPDSRRPTRWTASSARARWISPPVTPILTTIADLRRHRGGWRSGS